MIGRYLVLAGTRRDGWEARIGRIAERSRLEVAHDHFPVAVLRGGPCRCLSLGPSGAIVGTLFHLHGPPRPIEALDPEDAGRLAADGFDGLLRRYWGGYVAVRVEGGSVALIRDPSGALPCYFAEEDGLAAYASGADQLADWGLLRPRIDWAALPRQLFAAGLPATGTILEGVSELLPGFVHRPGSAQQHMAWNPWDHVGPARGFDSAARAERVGRAARQAVRGWASGFRRVLVGVSGGLDSSIVAACLAGGPVEALCATLFTDDPAGDERPYARTLCEGLGLELAELPYRHDLVDLDRAYAPHLPRPVGRIQAQAYDRALTGLARDRSVDAFITGNGGDNVFASSASAAAIADRWRAEGMGRGLVATVADTCRQTGASPAEAIAAALRILRRGARYRWRPDSRLLSREALERLAGLELRHPWLAAPEGALAGKAAHIAALLRAQHTLEPGRSRFASVLNPLMAQPLVEACLAVPSWAWRAGGEDRAVARRAFAASLPEPILRRRVKGTPDPFSAALLEARREAIGKRLVHGRLAGRGMLDADAIARALRGGLSRPAEDNLRLLELVAVEAWLDHWLACG